MPKTPTTYTYSVVPDDTATDVAERYNVAPWFREVMEGKMLLMDRNPRLTQAQEAVLRQNEMEKVFTKAPDGGVYVWLQSLAEDVTPEPPEPPQEPTSEAA